MKKLATSLVFAASLLFSCSSNHEIPLPPMEPSSSSAGEPSSGRSSSVTDSNSSLGGVDGKSSSSSFLGGVVVSSSSAVAGVFSTNVFTDQRDGKKYKFEFASDGKIWMSENLNYSRGNTLGWCYGVDIDGENPHRDSTSCGNGYGRIYKWSVAMDGNSSQGLCPSGWHIPSVEEWGQMAGITRIFPGYFNVNTASPPLGWKDRGESGFYWTSSGNNYYARFCARSSCTTAGTDASAAESFSVRCIASDDFKLSCGGTDYNPFTQFCSDVGVYNRCGGNTYNPSTHFCFGTATYTLCGRNTYDPSTQGCIGSTLYSKCGTTLYDSSVQFCSGSKPYDKCGGIDYNPVFEECVSGVVTNKPGSPFECKENNPKSGFTCAWNVTGTLTSGTTLKPAAYTLPSGCSSVEWKFADDITSIALNNFCDPTDANGFAALGSKNYVLFAELTCDDGKHTTACNPKAGLSSRTAPSLTGECKWDKNPTFTARGAVPSGVSVVDPDKVCSSPTVVYKYDDLSKTWPIYGILAEWKDWDKKHKETYEVKATLNCPAYPQTVTSSCPPLEVSAGTDYIIECTGGLEDSNCGGAARKTVNLKVDECVEINIMGYTDQLYLSTIVMRCEAQGAGQNVSVTMSLNGKAQTFTGSYSVQPLVTLGTVKMGDNEFGTLCVTALSGATGVKCTGPGR